MARQAYRGRGAQGSRELAETSIEQLYDAFSKDFQKALRARFGDIFPDKPLNPASLDDLSQLEDISGRLQQSKEYWNALDDVYAKFSRSMNELKRAGKLTSTGMTPLPKNEIMAKAELLIRSEYSMASEGLKSLGLDGAWSMLGRKLKKNMSAQKGTRQMGVTLPTVYEEMMNNPEAFARHFHDSKSLTEFVANLTGNAPLANKICRELKKNSPKDFRLLEAAMQLKIAPDVAAFPRVGIKGKMAGALRYLGRTNLASLVGGGRLRPWEALCEVIRNRRFPNLLFAIGSRRVRQRAYRSFSTSSYLHRVTAPWIVLGAASSWALYSYLLAPTVKKAIGLDSKPQKDPMEDALRGVASTNSNRKAVSRMLDGLKVGGRSLSEEEKLRALKIAGGAKPGSGRRRRTLTDYVQIVAIMQAMPKKSGKEIATISKAIYAYVFEADREKFARRALEVSKKNQKSGVGDIFSSVMNSKGLEKAVSDEYWGRSFTPPIFEGFVIRGRYNSSLVPLRADLRKACAAGKITRAQLTGLARMFAAMYSMKDRAGRESKMVPATYGADLEAAMGFLKRGFKPSEIGTAMESIRDFLPYFAKQKAQDVAADLSKKFPRTADGVKVRTFLIDYLRDNEGFAARRDSLQRYSRDAIGELVDGNGAIEKGLLPQKRAQIANDLASRFMDGDLTYVQVVQVVGSLGRGILGDTAYRDSLRKSKPSELTSIMGELVESEFPPVKEDAGPAEEAR